MSEQMMAEILKRLDLIGEKLGEGGAFAWQAYMRQAYVVRGWGATVVGLLFLPLAILLWRKMMRTPSDDNFGWFVGAVVCSAIGAFALIDGVAHILNPAYYALMDLSRMLGK